MFSVWTDLIEYFCWILSVLHASEKLHYFKIHQEYLLMKEKTRTGARSGRPGLTNHILKVVKILYGMLGSVTELRVGESDPLFVFRTNNIA